MKAEASDAPRLRYSQEDWGDLIRGTKEQLQALGLGVGLAYPGEPGGPKRAMTVRDPRGYKARISRGDRYDGRFCVRLEFPNWPKQPLWRSSEWKSAFPGVMRCERGWFDEYVGRAEDLAAAGLVRVNQLPGQPGMRKMRVTIFPDGTLPSGAPTVAHHQSRMPGARWIERASASSYRVCFRLPDEEVERRRAAARLAEDAWRQEVRALPRPPRLGGGLPPELPLQVTRACLRLVWSAPAHP